jgi:hypothetical protein
VGGAVFALSLMFAFKNMFNDKFVLTNLLEEKDLSTSKEDTNQSTNNHFKKKKIKLLALNRGIQTAHSALSQLALDSIVNKACYSEMWDYDFIFKMTPGFTE